MRRHGQIGRPRVPQREEQVQAEETVEQVEEKMVKQLDGIDLSDYTPASRRSRTRGVR